jgi:hypothetical protein
MKQVPALTLLIAEDHAGTALAGSIVYKEETVASTPVKPEQFEISNNSIIHKPTGCTFTSHPGQTSSGNMRLGQLGNKLASGEDYRPDEVKSMMQQLWAKHCAERK